MDLRDAGMSSGNVRPRHPTASAPTPRGIAISPSPVADEPFRHTSLVFSRPSGSSTTVTRRPSRSRWLTGTARVPSPSDSLVPKLRAYRDGRRRRPVAGFGARPGSGARRPRAADIWAGKLDSARYSDEDFAVISLCRLGEPFPHPVHRMTYIADIDHNAGLDVMLADVLDDMKALHDEGHRLLVHCHGGASRTGLVLRGWLVREKGMSVEEATAHVRERWPHLGLWNDSFTAALERLAPGCGDIAPQSHH